MGRPWRGRAAEVLAKIASEAATGEPGVAGTTRSPCCTPSRRRGEGMGESELLWEDRAGYRISSVTARQPRAREQARAIPLTRTAAITTARPRPPAAGRYAEAGRLPRRRSSSTPALRRVCGAGICFAEMGKLPPGPARLQRTCKALWNRVRVGPINGVSHPRTGSPARATARSPRQCGIPGEGRRKLVHGYVMTRVSTADRDTPAPDESRKGPPRSAQRRCQTCSNEEDIASKRNRQGRRDDQALRRPTGAGANATKILSTRPSQSTRPAGAGRSAPATASSTASRANARTLYGQGCSRPCAERNPRAAQLSSTAPLESNPTFVEARRVTGPTSLATSADLAEARRISTGASRPTRNGPTAYAGALCRRPAWRKDAEPGRLPWCRSRRSSARDGAAR